jgi:5-(carboxyamino)imidazole ribonucleotide mutase
MEPRPVISVIMGSKSDFSTMEKTCLILDEFNISYETLVVSAHRTPDRMFEFAKSAKSRGIKIIIAGAGGAAHLPGMVAALTTLPVIGVPVKSKALKGIDSLLSIVQMPAGVPVATVAIGEAGAKNAAILAVSILGIENKDISRQLDDFKSRQKASVPVHPEEDKK